MIKKGQDTTHIYIHSHSLLSSDMWANVVLAEIQWHFGEKCYLYLQDGRTHDMSALTTTLFTFISNCTGNATIQPTVHRVINRDMLVTWILISVIISYENSCRSVLRIGCIEFKKRSRPLQHQQTPSLETVMETFLHNILQSPVVTMSRLYVNKNPTLY